MIGYLAHPKIGARMYNLFHHKLVAIAVFVVGAWLDLESMILAGTILFGHSAMDRLLGYGLKYDDDFKNTHLGHIGKTN